jgi:hypothetical protein
MAIPKVKSKSVEWSTQSLVQLGVAGALVLLSLLMGYFAIARFQLKRNLVEGLRAMDSHDEGNAIPALQSAVGWKPSHGGARLALAKMLVDAGTFDEAATHYQQLLTNPDFVEKGLAQVGLGVIALKRAEKAKDDKEFAAQIKAAQEAYKAAGGVPEAKIGLRLADLLVALRAKNGEAITKLQTAFSGLHTDIRKSGGSVTKDGLIDLYAAAGLCYAYNGGYSKEASQFFNSCYAIAPRWPLPLINKVYMEAARFRTGTDMNAKTLQETKVKYDTDKNDWDMLATGPAYAGLREAWYQFQIAHAYRFGEAGEFDSGFSNYLHNLKSKTETKNRWETWKLGMGVTMRRALRPGLSPDSRNTDIGRARIEIEAFLNDENSKRTDPDTIALKAVALCNKAVCLEQQGAYDIYPPAYMDAAKALKEALDIEKKSLNLPDGSYETNRNLAVILKRLNDKDAETYYNAAVKLGDSSEKAREDVGRLKQYWAGTLKE